MTIDADQVRYLPDPGLPPLTDAAVTGKVTGRTVQLAIGQATADLGGGRSMKLSEASFAMPEFWMQRAPANIGFRIMGPADALVALLAFPALKDFSPGRIDPVTMKGTADLKVALTLPLFAGMASMLRFVSGLAPMPIMFCELLAKNRIIFAVALLLMLVGAWYGTVGWLTQYLALV